MDWLYYSYLGVGLFMFIAIAITIYAQVKVSNTYNAFSKVECKSGKTGLDFAKEFIKITGLNIKINIIQGHLSDFYNPSNKSINISQQNAVSSSVAALGVVAHELGHALQDAKDYKPLKARQMIIKVSSFASKILVPMLIVGILFNLFYATGIVGGVFIWGAVAFYGISVIVSLATLPVEYDASSRALKMLGGMQTLDGEEVLMTKKVLSAAALTYVASLLVSVVFFLRFLLMALMITRDR